MAVHNNMLEITLSKLSNLTYPNLHHARHSDSYIYSLRAFSTNENNLDIEKSRRKKKKRNKSVYTILTIRCRIEECIGAVLEADARRIIQAAIEQSRSIQEYIYYCGERARHTVRDRMNGTRATRVRRESQKRERERDALSQAE